MGKYRIITGLETAVEEYERDSPGDAMDRFVESAKELRKVHEGFVHQDLILQGQDSNGSWTELARIDKVVSWGSS